MLWKTIGVQSPRSVTLVTSPADAPVTVQNPGRLSGCVWHTCRALPLQVVDNTEHLLSDPAPRLLVCKPLRLPPAPGCVWRTLCTLLSDHVAMPCELSSLRCAVCCIGLHGSQGITQGRSQGEAPPPKPCLVSGGGARPRFWNLGRGACPAIT
jgi:hypothetical protein